MKQEDKPTNFNKELMANLEKNLTCSKCKKVPRDATVFITISFSSEPIGE
jgi:hypothetical protein